MSIEIAVLHLVHRSDEVPYRTHERPRHEERQHDGDDEGHGEHKRQKRIEAVQGIHVRGYVQIADQDEAVLVQHPAGDQHVAALAPERVRKRPTVVQRPVVVQMDQGRHHASRHVDQAHLVHERRVGVPDELCTYDIEKDVGDEESVSVIHRAGHVHNDLVAVVSGIAEVRRIEYAVKSHVRHPAGEVQRRRHVLHGREDHASGGVDDRQVHLTPHAAEGEQHLLHQLLPIRLPAGHVPGHHFAAGERLQSGCIVAYRVAEPDHYVVHRHVQLVEEVRPGDPVPVAEDEQGRRDERDHDREDDGEYDPGAEALGALHPGRPLKCA